MATNWLQMLVGGLAGGAGAGAEYYGKKRAVDQEKAERDAAIARQQDQWKQQFDAGQEALNLNRATASWDRLNPDEDITDSPQLANYRKLGLGTRTVAPKLSPKVADSLTLPSLPSFGLPPVPPGTPEQGPATPVGGDTPALIDQGPTNLTVATPSYGMPTPGKITRSETRQESQERVERDSEIQMLESLVPKVAPQYAAILQGSIEALKKGGRAQITAAQVGQLVQESQPKPSSASAAPNFEYTDAFEIANGKPFDPATATAAERKKANDEMARQRIAGTREPRGPQGPSQTLSAGQISTTYQGALRRADSRPEIKDYREMGRNLTAVDEAMTIAKENGNMVAVDQALINAFNKLMDPTSVVRESEYARTKNDLSIFNRLKGSVGPDGQLALGGAGLTTEDREAIARMARLFAASAKRKALAAQEDLAAEYDEIDAGGRTVGDMLRKAWTARAPSEDTGMVILVDPTGKESRPYTEQEAQALLAASPALKRKGGGVK